MHKPLSKEELLTKRIFEKIDKLAAKSAEAYADIARELSEALGTEDYLNTLMKQRIEKRTGEQNEPETETKGFGEIEYDQTKNTVTFHNVTEKDLSEEFIKYVLEACDIPEDVTIKFKP